MSYSYLTDGGSSDIELVSQPGPCKNARVAGVEATSTNNSYNGDEAFSQQDYGDFFAQDNGAAWLPPAFVRQQLQQQQQPSTATAAQTTQATTTRMQTGKSDVIEIGDSDDGDDAHHPAARPPGALRKTHSAPSAIFGEKSRAETSSKGKQRLFEPLVSDDDDEDDDDEELPNLKSMAARSNILKRSNSDTVDSVSTSKRRFKYTDRTTDKDQQKGKRILSPIPASSPPPSLSLYQELPSRDRPQAIKSGGLHLPSDLDSSDDEDKKPMEQKQVRAPVKSHPTSEAGPSKAKAPTQKQIAEQAKAAKKAEKDKEKAERAVSCVYCAHTCSLGLNELMNASLGGACQSERTKKRAEDCQQAGIATRALQRDHGRYLSPIASR